MSDGPGSESDSSTAVISRMLSDANYTSRVSQALRDDMISMKQSDEASVTSDLTCASCTQPDNVRNTWPSSSPQFMLHHSLETLS